jgi:hypothetical protein
MSYDLTIRADDRYSKSAPVGPLSQFIGQLTYIRANGDRGFAWEAPPDRWMEIDLEVVNTEGDNIEEKGRTYPEVNCVSLHIPYGHFDDSRERPYLPVARTIAEHLGWKVFDDQKGRYIPVHGTAGGKSAEERQLKLWE